MFFITLNKTLCIYLPPATAGIHLFLITSILPHLPMYACNSRHLFVPYNIFPASNPLSMACNSRHLFVPYNTFSTVLHSLTPATAGIYLFLITSLNLQQKPKQPATAGIYLFLITDLSIGCCIFSPATAGIYLFLITRFAEKSFTISIHPYHITFEHF